MRWIKDKRKRAGGYRGCIVKRRAAGRRYNRSEKGRARDHRYRSSPVGALNYKLHEMARVRVRY